MLDYLIGNYLPQKKIDQGFYGFKRFTRIKFKKIRINLLNP
jgi:hypothetical protein